MRIRRAFTLVELLVVIGIIAVLVGILLPALNAARRSAGAVKCASQLREVGMAFRLYDGDFRGYFPVAQYGGSYTLYGTVYPVTTDGKSYNAYWINFLAKYVTKAKVGGAGTAVDVEQAKKSVLWGCPSFDGYAAAGITGGVARVQNGFGMNAYPTFRADNYRDSSPPNNEVACGGNFLSPPGDFQKSKLWKPATDTCLVADSRFWLVESTPPPSQASYPPAVVAQSDYNNVSTYSGTGQTMVDIYRHGKMPKQIGTNLLDPYGGKIAFNVLYADGHVSTPTDGKEAYRSIRKKFPG